MIIEYNPDTHVLFPREPTSAMKRALFINLINADNEATVIKAIIAAAPAVNLLQVEPTDKLLIEQLDILKEQRKDLADIIRDVSTLLSRHHKMHYDEFITDLSGIITAATCTSAFTESKKYPSDAEILKQFEDVISEDPQAYEKPDACVYQITNTEVIEYYKRITQPKV